MRSKSKHMTRMLEARHRQNLKGSVGSTVPKQDTSVNEALIEAYLKESGKITQVSPGKQIKIRDRRPTKSW